MDESQVTVTGGLGDQALRDFVKYSTVFNNDQSLGICECLSRYINISNDMKMQFKIEPEKLFQILSQDNIKIMALFCDVFLCDFPRKIQRCIIDSVLCGHQIVTDFLEKRFPDREIDSNTLWSSLLFNDIPFFDATFGIRYLDRKDTKVNSLRTLSEPNRVYFGIFPTHVFLSSCQVCQVLCRHQHLTSGNMCSLMYYLFRNGYDNSGCLPCRNLTYVYPLFGMSWVENKYECAYSNDVILILRVMLNNGSVVSDIPEHQVLFGALRKITSKVINTVGELGTCLNIAMNDDCISVVESFV